MVENRDYTAENNVYLKHKKAYLYIIKIYFIIDYLPSIS